MQMHQGGGGYAMRGGRGGRRIDPNIRPDGRNRRDPVVRKTVDFIAPLIKHLMVKFLFQCV
jgi:hypothetical protein